MSSTASRTNSPQQQRTRQKAAGHTPHASFSLPPPQLQHQQQQQQQQQLAGGQPINVQAQVQPPNARMSPASRYQSNLKVLRRRDPSIISIFDQFSHVCVYHHNGQKWEKHGYEGSMFLFERESYPPYGFYILNRVGSEDYVQRLYPEDDITAHGGYLMLRSYPHFTNARLDAITNSPAVPTAEINNKFSVLYAYRNDAASSKDKGESQTIGLWTFAADGREPMMDVMLRLHAYIKKNLPYPDDYRYGPDRPPPLNPHLRVGPVPGASATASNGNSTAGYRDESEYAAVAQQQQQLYSTAPMAQNGMSNINLKSPGAVGLSDVDKLFARFLPPGSAPGESGTDVGVPSVGGAPQQQPLPSLMATLGGGSTSGMGDSVLPSHAQQQQQSPQQQFAGLVPPQVNSRHHQQQPLEQYPNFGVPTQPQTQTQASSTGIGLLDAMFASASGGPASTIASAPTPPTLPPTTIYQSQGAPLSFTSAGNYLQPQQTLGHGTYPMQLPSFAFPNAQTNRNHNLSPPSQKQTSIPIHSPTPQSKVLPPPQVLSQNVIGSLLGLDRASAGGGDAGTGSGGENSAESPTHSSSRDGDNELELSLSSEDGGNSTSHGSSEEGGGVDGSASASGVRGLSRNRGAAGGGALTRPPAGEKEKEKEKKRAGAMASEQAFKNLGLNVPPGSGIGGDTTPKPGYLGGDHLKGLAGATPSETSATTTSTTTTTTTTSSATATTAAKPNGTPEKKKKKNANVKPRNEQPHNERPLVPFESSSELWPYPRQPLDEGNPEPHAGADDTSNSNDNGGSGGGEGGDIVELDWEDMSALSDLKEFERVQKAQSAARSKGAGATAGGGKGDSGLAAGAGQEGGRKKKEKKNKNKQQQQQNSKREKLEAAMRAKEELEKSWDFPDVTAVQQRNVHNGAGVDVGSGNGTYGSGAGWGWDAGTGIGNGMMNLNGKTVPRPVAFHDDSLPATPSPVPSPVTPLSPTRSTTAARQAGYDDPRVDEGQIQTPHEQEEEGEEEVVSLSSSVNGSATKKKKKNRRKLGSSSSKSKSGPPDSVGVPDDGSLFDVAGSNVGVDASVNGDEDGEVEESRLMKSLLSALSSSSSGKIVSGGVVERDALVNEVMRLMKNEKFVDELWRGYNSEL